jgi:hypothetical protein
MERRLVLSVLVLLLAVAGCSSSSTTDSEGAGDSAGAGSTASTPASYADPAARVAHEFLEAVVQGETARASALLTPLAVERIVASGKPFQLPGLANYTFRVGEVRHPAPDKAFVQCTGSDRSAEGKVVEEEFCWLISLVDQDWRIAGISYTAGPQQTLMIYSFEDPEKGAIPVERLMAPSVGQTAATTGQPPAQPQSAGNPTETPSPSPSLRTAQEAIPTGAYR